MAIRLRGTILSVVALIAVLGGSLVLGRSVYADNSSNDKPIYLQISPVKQKLKLQPGQSYVSSIKVRNIGTERFTYRVTVAPYSVIDDRYNADYESTKNDYTKMYNWVKIDEKLQTGVIEPKTEVEVPFTVTVPSDMHLGGQYAAIMAETSNGNNESTIIKTINRLGMILYADVTSGSIDIDGKILNNTINSFVLEPPLTVSSTVENTGNFEANATYTVKIWPLGSNETVYNNEDNPVKLDIIPKTRRYNAITWEGAPHLGVFTVEQKVEYPGIEPLIERKLVIICPFWLVLLLLIILTVLIIWLVSRIIKRQKAKVQNSNQERRI